MTNKTKKLMIRIIGFIVIIIIGYIIGGIIK